MAQAVNCRCLTTESTFRYQASSWDIRGEQSGTGTDFPPSTSVFPCQYHAPNALYSSSAIGNMEKCLQVCSRES